VQGDDDHGRQRAAAGLTPEEFKEIQTRFNTALPEKGANLSSPVNGLIVRWRLQGAVGGPFTLRVLRPNGSGAYTAVGSSGRRRRPA